MPFLSVEKPGSATVDLHYEDLGSGQPVVLIHGWPLSGAAWERQVPALLDAGHRVIAYDRRGFGASSKPATGYDYDTFAADLDRLMTTLDLRDVVLVGHSMGTGEITHYLGRYGSERVDRGVLIGVLPPFLLKTQDNPDGVDGAVFQAIEDAIRKDRYAYAWEFLENFYNSDVLGEDRISRRAMHASWNLAARSSAIGFLQCVFAWTTDFRTDLQRLDVPLLLIHGDSDRILPIEATAIPFSKGYRDSRLVTVPDGPHGIPWTHADIVNREILGFIAERSQARAA